MKGLIKVYKALSDESRLRVLNLLSERECCVCEVEQVLEISQSKASRILGTLYDAGFLTLRKEGLWSLYSINWEGMGDHLKSILEAARSGFIGNQQMEADRKRLKTIVRIGLGCANQTCASTLDTKAVKS